MAAPEPSTEKGFSAIIEMTIKPDSVDLFLQHFKHVLDLVRAEPECLSYEVFRDPEQPNRFKWIENWSKSKEWFMEHQYTKPYMKPYFEATQPLWEGERKIEFLERLGGSWARAKEGVYERV